MQDDQQQAQPLPNEPTPAVETTVPQSLPTEVEPSSGPVSTPGADAVWISKEEYQRLKQAEATQAKAALERPAKLFGGLQVATSALAAVALILGLMMSQQSAIMFALVPASLVILMLMGVFTWIDYLQAKKGGQIREHKVRNAVMFIFALLCFALPVAFPMIGLLFLVLMCGFGGCRGS